jgi:hypothetical protein
MMEEKWIAAKPPGSVAATAAAAGAQAATAAAAGAQAANQTAPAAPQSKKRKQGKRMVEPFVYVPLVGARMYCWVVVVLAAHSASKLMPACKWFVGILGLTCGCFSRLLKIMLCQDC